MDLLRQKQKCMGGLNGVFMEGGGPSNSTTKGAETNTTNTDKRLSVQDGIGISGDSNTVVYNSPDAVKAIAQAGADVIKSSGGAVVELAKLQTTANADAWNATLTTGAKLVDRLIERVGDGFTLSSKVVDSFQPAVNKSTDAIKWAAIAAAALGVASLWGKK